MPAAPPLRNISETALLVAYYRALEGRRPRPILNDPYAERLGGARAAEVARKMGWMRFSAWPNIVRARLGDDLVTQEVARGAEVVLNLAAGLDSRPYRLDLPPALGWIEVDLPEMIAYKQQALAGEAPRCRLERVALDLADRAARRELFTRVNQSARRVVVVSEGLLVYLQPEAVIALAQDLAAQPNFATWLADIAGPGVLKRMKKQWGKKLEAANATMHFAPAESVDFFRPYGWQPAEFCNLFEEGRRLQRTPALMTAMMSFWKRVAPRRFEQRMRQWKSGFVRLTRARPAAGS